MPVRVKRKKQNQITWCATPPCLQLLWVPIKDMARVTDNLCRGVMGLSCAVACTVRISYAEARDTGKTPHQG